MTEFYVLFLIFFPFIAAIPLYIIGRRNEKARDILVILTAAIEVVFALLILLNPIFGFGVKDLCWLGLSFRTEKFPAIMALIASLLWLGTALVSPEYFAHGENRNRYYLFYLFTLGAIEGVFLSADLGTTFVFFEVMSFTSYVWVAQNETEDALKAAKVYLTIAVLGGLVLLMGLYLLWDVFGTLNIADIRSLAGGLDDGDKARLFAAGCCLLFGFGAKAGMFPVHMWLPMAHPVAPAPASALLSGILTKSGVFGIIAVTASMFSGTETWGALVLVLGTITMVGGAVLAIISKDLKRTLACSSMSQIGFILVGVGTLNLLGAGNTLPAWGTVLHMFNHSTIKLVLFVSAGVVYLNTHSLDLDEVRGFGRGKIWLLIPFLMAALAIGGIPFWSGYISKTLLHEGLVEYMAEGGAYTPLCHVVEVLFLFSGGLTLAYMTNLFVTLFVDKPKKETTGKYMGIPTKIVLMVGGIVLFVCGFLPNITMVRAATAAETFLGANSAGMHAIHFFSLENLKGAGISIAIGALVYFLIMRKPAVRGIASFINGFRSGVAKAFSLSVRGLIFLLAIITRFFAALGDWVAVLIIKILFHRAPRTVNPRQHVTYGRDKQEHIIERTFSFDLLLAGIGVLAILVYLFVHLKFIFLPLSRIIKIASHIIN